MSCGAKKQSMLWERKTGNNSCALVARYLSDAVGEESQAFLPHDAHIEGSGAFGSYESMRCAIHPCRILSSKSVSFIASPYKSPCAATGLDASKDSSLGSKQHRVGRSAPRPFLSAPSHAREKNTHGSSRVCVFHAKFALSDWLGTPSSMEDSTPLVRKESP